MRDTNSGEMLSTGAYAPFRTGEPNGLEAENCVSMYPNGGWLDFDCNQLSVSPCYIERMPPQFKLRGDVFYNSFTICVQTKVSPVPVLVPFMVLGTVLS